MASQVWLMESTAHADEQRSLFIIKFTLLFVVCKIPSVDCDVVNTASEKQIAPISFNY